MAALDISESLTKRNELQFPMTYQSSFDTFLVSKVFTSGLMLKNTMTLFLEDELWQDVIDVYRYYIVQL